jgi:hypothetical protein
MVCGVCCDTASAALGGVVCFDLNEEGLLDNFLCQMVRVTCVYAACHKNTRWHGYAAALTAAFVKGLLENV